MRIKNSLRMIIRSLLLAMGLAVPSPVDSAVQLSHQQRIAVLPGPYMDLIRMRMPAYNNSGPIKALAGKWNRYIRDGTDWQRRMDHFQVFALGRAP